MVAVLVTILVVDDEPQIVQLVRNYLEHGEFTVLTASDGAIGLAIGADRPGDHVTPWDCSGAGNNTLDTLRRL